MTTYWEEQKPIWDVPGHLAVAAATPDAAVHVGPSTESRPARITPVLITEQEAVFGSSAAVSLPRTTIRHRLARALRRILVASQPILRSPRRRHYPSRHEYLERSFLAREMFRL
jgi:hypothetical protein